MSTTTQGPVASSQMLIRKPAAQVFAAIVDPSTTSHFWFTRASGRLEAGKRVRWDWEMYGVSTQVDVQEVEEGRRILLEWNGPDNPSLVEWRFEPKGDERTFVTVRNWGFRGQPDDAAAQADVSAAGFSFVLAGLKAYLEHGIELHLIEDHDPDALVERAAARDHS
jgi:uncharacterized protein YndB with AHSA1/START domain